MKHCELDSCSATGWLWVAVRQPVAVASVGTPVGKPVPVGSGLTNGGGNRKR